MYVYIYIYISSTLGIVVMVWGISTVFGVRDYENAALGSDATDSRLRPQFLLHPVLVSRAHIWPV